MQASPVSEIESRLRWYDSKARLSRILFLTAKVVELLAAAAIPIVAILEVNPVLIASLGAAIAVVAGVEQLFRFQESWINYRRTAEALRTELFLYRTNAGPYGEQPSASAAAQLLANRSVDHFLRESSRWEALAKQSDIPHQEPGDPTGASRG